MPDCESKTPLLTGVERWVINGATIEAREYDGHSGVGERMLEVVEVCHPPGRPRIARLELSADRNTNMTTVDFVYVDGDVESYELVDGNWVRM